VEPPQILLELSPTIREEKADSIEERCSFAGLHSVLSLPSLLTICGNPE